MSFPSSFSKSCCTLHCSTKTRQPVDSQSLNTHPISVVGLNAFAQGLKTCTAIVKSGAAFLLQDGLQQISEYYPGIIKSPLTQPQDQFSEQIQRSRYEPVCPFRFSNLHSSPLVTRRTPKIRWKVDKTFDFPKHSSSIGCLRIETFSGTAIVMRY